jgi:hypothetical protein
MRRVSSSSFAVIVPSGFARAGAVVAVMGPTEASRRVRREGAEGIYASRGGGGCHGADLGRRLKRAVGARFKALVRGNVSRREK